MEYISTKRIADFDKILQITRLRREEEQIWEGKIPKKSPIFQKFCFFDRKKNVVK